MPRQAYPKDWGLGPRDGISRGALGGRMPSPIRSGKPALGCLICTYLLKNHDLSQILQKIMVMNKNCLHIKNSSAEIRARTPNGCEECLKMGDEWVHLRLCLTCGHVGCCDSSKNKHATKHFHSTQHPVIRSFEPGETWKWCYVDEFMAEA